jgi:hypothetical protein
MENYDPTIAPVDKATVAKLIIPCVLESQAKERDSPKQSTGRTPSLSLRLKNARPRKRQALELPRLGAP